MWNKLRLLFEYGPEIEALLVERRQKAADEAHKAKYYHLDLCLKHKQEANQSHFSEHNCDFCKVKKELTKLGGHYGK